MMFLFRLLKSTNSLPTPLGTILDCDRYYEVRPRDACAFMSIKLGITFAQLRGKEQLTCVDLANYEKEMDPSINADCTNLLREHEYW